MGYGALNKDQRRALAKHVRGKNIHDLGAGDLGYALELLRMGAAEVYAIDKEPKPRLSPWPKKLHYKQAYFHQVTSRMDTIFLAWPINHDVNLRPHLLQAETIIYLGCNTGGSMCGTPDLFKVMIQRELLVYEPDPRNSLVIVGKRLEGPREPTGEEFAGLTTMVNYLSFAEAEARYAG